MITLAVHTVQNENKLKTKAEWAKPHIAKHTIMLENNEENRRFVSLLNRLVSSDEFINEVTVRYE